MSSETSAAEELRVFIFPPTRRDGEVTCAVLEKAGVDCAVCNEAAALAERISAGLGAVILTDALAGTAGLPLILAALGGQPTWSDTPTVLLSRAGLQSEAVTRLMANLTNVTVLDRPTSTRTLVSAVQAAIRGRRRQYQLRDQLTVLHKAEEALRVADRRKDEFLAMLAHELRNPLAPIRTAGELLSRGIPGAPMSKQAVDIVKRQVTHLTRLVDDLLDVSRINQGRIQLQRQAVALDSIVAQALESVEASAREKRHQITTVSTAQPLFVNGDSDRLIQCVTNLLTNAIKYTDPGGRVQVAIREENSQAVLSVTDNGIGIPEDLLPRIFGLFVQNSQSLDRAEGGLGIGLSVVEKLIDMHGGRVLPSSAGVGQGSNFEIWLPRIECPMSPAIEPADIKLSGKRVLVVDDNVDAASSLAELLSLDGHDCKAVFSARDALHEFDSFLPDVVLLDIGLPDMDGYQVGRVMRQRRPSARIIALTGYGNAQDIERTREEGFAAHMVKPVSLERLEAIMAGDGIVSSRQN